jgi:hypothetical protein
MRANRDQRADFDVGCDDGRGMNARNQFLGGIEAVHGPGEGRARLSDADHRAITGAGIIDGNDQAAGRRLLRLAHGFAIAHERKIRAAGGFEGGNTREFLFAVAFVSRTEPLG